MLELELDHGHEPTTWRVAAQALGGAFTEKARTEGLQETPRPVYITGNLRVFE